MMNRERYICPSADMILMEEAGAILEDSPRGSLENPGQGDVYDFGW